MTRVPGKHMIKALRKHWIQITVILSVYLIFLGNALGLIDIGLQVSPHPVRLDLHTLGTLLGLAGGNLPTILGTTEFIVFCITGLALSVLLPTFSPIKASALTFVAMCPVVWLEYANPVGIKALPMEYSLLMILILFAVNVLTSYFTETHKKQELINIFGQYVPPEVARIMSQDPDAISLEGEARQLTVMFCDIHDFTTISEGMEPRQLTSMLNSLFTPLTSVLYRHNGTIDKYMGDAIMAFWGAPLDDPDHAVNAVRAAFDIQAMLRELAPEFEANGWPTIRMGIGINTGMANVGNMGSKFRMAYTAVGDAVNLASRLEHLTRTYRAPIIVGQGTREAVSDYVYRELDLVKVKGKQENTRIYEPLCLTNEADTVIDQMLQLHNQGLGAYYRQDWKHALSKFTQLQRLHPEDEVNTLFIKRIEDLQAHPPAAGWKGETAYNA